jgi:hypothetical protein
MLRGHVSPGKKLANYLGWATGATGATSATSATSAATGVFRTAFRGLSLVGADESAPHTLVLLVRVLNRMMSDGAEPSNVITWTTFRVRVYRA